MSMQPQPAEPISLPPSRPAGVLGLIERLGNALPDPTVLFIIGALIVMALSAVAAWDEWSVTPKVAQLSTDAGGQQSVTFVDRIDPATGQPQVIRARNLLSSEGLFWALDNMVRNFVNFTPLGVVLTGMLGIGVAERTGLFGALLRAFMLVVPVRMFTPTMVFLGIMSSLGLDAGYVVLPPLAAALYASVGRSPLAGIAAVFAGVAAGFNANLLITGLDPMLAELSTIGAQVVDPGYAVAPTCNWWFMIASTIVITGVGWLVTARFVEPRLSTRPAEEGGAAAGMGGSGEVEAQRLTPLEWKGLWMALAAMGALAGLVILLALTEGSPLYGKSPRQPTFDRWVAVIVPIIFFMFLVPGLLYGVVMGSIRSSKDAAKAMVEAIAAVAPIIVLAFFAAQFIEYLNYTQLSQMMAFAGGELLASARMPAWALIVVFIVMILFFNLFIGSMSAKYTMIAPIFVPMFMIVGISPELTQAAYRIGDSVTNVITPLNAYLVIILVFMQRYARSAGMGTLVSMMLPYSIAFFLVWTLLLLAWMWLGIPLGINGPLTYPS